MKRSETALNIRVYVTENKRRIGTLFLLGEHAFLLVITRNHKLSENCSEFVRSLNFSVITAYLLKYGARDYRNFPNLFLKDFGE